MFVLMLDNNNLREVNMKTIQIHLTTKDYKKLCRSKKKQGFANWRSMLLSAIQ